MNSKSFITTLVMSLAGLIFIIIALLPIVFNIVKCIENINIKNKGEQIIANITYRGIIDNDDYDDYATKHGLSLGEITRTYRIEYIVNNKQYSKTIVSTEKHYKEGDNIEIYCLSDNPNEIYVPIENKGRILSLLIVCPIFLILGFACIRRYNIFRYKKL